MASISREPNGRRTVQFTAADGRRKSIRLGKVSQRIADEIKVKVEHLNGAIVSNLPLDNETAQWVAKLGDDLAGKLAAAGLIPERVSMTLGAFLDDYITGRSDVKSGTRTNYSISRDRLLAFFKPVVNLRDVTEGDVDAWVVFLRNAYAQATVSRTIKHARQFFKSAVRRRLVPSNPFADVKAGAQTNTTRAFFVTRETAARVLDSCMDNEWKLVFALSRFAGLRCPSEHLRLRWEDVDWERGRMLIRAPKKEHLEDGGERWLPIFPEVKPYLERAFEDAEDGAVYVITRYRDSNVNLRTRLLKTIRRAGLKSWPRLFQNLRASCETELAQSYPLHVVCEWIGNSAKVAADHYLQVTDADFERGAKTGAAALQNAVQHHAAPSRTSPQETTEALPEQGFVRDVAVLCDNVHPNRMTPTGFEPVSQP